MKARRPFAMIPLWVYDDPNTTPTVLAVYTALAAFYDTGPPLVSDLIDRSRLSRSTIYAALATLERMGAIRRRGAHVYQVDGLWRPSPPPSVTSGEMA